MHKSIEPLYRCTKADKLQFTPLELTPLCCGQMRIIAFITYSADIRHILEHFGATTKPPRITPARGPTLWAGADALMRRWAMVSMLRQIGMKRPKWRRTSRSISASVGHPSWKVDLES